MKNFEFEDIQGGKIEIVAQIVEGSKITFGFRKFENVVTGLKVFEACPAFISEKSVVERNLATLEQEVGKLPDTADKKQAVLEQTARLVEVASLPKQDQEKQWTATKDGVIEAANTLAGGTAIVLPTVMNIIAALSTLSGMPV